MNYFRFYFMIFPALLTDLQKKAGRRGAASRRVAGGRGQKVKKY